VCLPQFTDDDSMMVRLVGSEFHIYENNNFGRPTFMTI